MDNEQTMVEESFDDAATDDTLPEDIAEETDESEESLDSLNDEPQAEPAEQPPQKEASEPGWIKQRVNKAVEKAVAETERRMQAEFDRQMAPIREKMLNDEARDLVRQGEFKSLERAKEYLQLKQGITPTAEPKQEQPRNDRGQFAPKRDEGMQTRVNMLAHQADQIKARSGIDVMAEYNSNPEIKDKIFRGEIDFYDVAEMMSKQPKGRKAPAPMRSPNGASGANTNSITTMSDEAFDRMEKRIKEGARYKLN